MSRRPFDPDRASGGELPFDEPARRERARLGGLHEADRITVGQLSELIRQTLEGRIASPLRVVGEVSNFTDRKHWFFSLKDEDAVIGCVAWASSAARIRTTPHDGDEVVATGYVSHYGPQGRTQLYVSSIEPVGAGSLEQQFRALCEELRAAGYFDDSHKVRLPAYPRRIAVITSKTSAALQDVLATSRDRWVGVELLVVDARMQGDGAADELARTIRRLDAHAGRLGVDAILVTRGGGSLEDLWTFNERIVAEATFACRTPIVAAIGHESDTTVIELVADVRAATPTQAIMRLIPDAVDIRRQLDHQYARLRALMQRRLELAHHRMHVIERSAVFRDPAQLQDLWSRRIDDVARALRESVRGTLHRRERHLEEMDRRFGRVRPTARMAHHREQLRGSARRLRQAIRWRLERESSGIDAVMRSLSAIDPTAVLRRGYSMTYTDDGRIVRSAGDVTSGDVLRTRLGDGDVRSSVLDATEASGESHTRGGRTPARRRSSGRASTNRPQLDLFDGEG